MYIYLGGWESKGEDQESRERQRRQRRQRTAVRQACNDGKGLPREKMRGGKKDLSAPPKASIARGKCIPGL